MIVYLPGAVDAQQAVGERLGDSEYFVDSRRLADEVWIKCADDDARMVETVVVKANEMLAIEGEEDSSLCAREREHLFVRHGLAGFAGVDNGSGHRGPTGAIPGRQGVGSSRWRKVAPRVKRPRCPRSDG